MGANPAAFMTLLGKILPTTLQGPDGGAPLVPVLNVSIDALPRKPARSGCKADGWFRGASARLWRCLMPAAAWGDLDQFCPKEVLTQINAKTTQPRNIPRYYC